MARLKMTLGALTVFFSMLLLAVPTASSDLVRNVEEVSSDSTLTKETRIIGGWEALEDRYPYVVSVQSDSIGHFCGGTLVAKDVVITAAHCVRDDDDTITAVIGGNSVYEGEMIRVISALKHGSYNTITDGYDVGLLFLEHPTTLDITLPILNDDNEYPPLGATTYALGWGDTDVETYEQVSDWLMVVDLEVISNEACSAAEKGDVSYKNWVTDDMMCTYRENKDACQGGPLIVRPGGGATYDILVGLVSWGVGCAYLPGVFSRVSMSYDWILEVVCAESQDPTGSMCDLNRISDSQISSTTSMSHPTYVPNASLNERPTSTPSLSSEPSSSPPTLAPPLTSSPTLSPTTSKLTTPPRSSSSSKKTAEPEISTLREDEVDGIIFEEESKAPVNSSSGSGCSYVAVAAVGSTILMWMMR
ncbi:hypothetical protein ACHAW5_009452 [Stephanodiscus triporus]|uniref:Peptidase S1 domain-containing protein n=1 Tax=Stephanodiscus triporus TaxID=2934178 RepID=A0ABD3R0Z6_9STRA